MSLSREWPLVIDLQGTSNRFNFIHCKRMDSESGLVKEQKMLKTEKKKNKKRKLCQK